MVKLLNFRKRHVAHFLLGLAVTHHITNWLSNINQFSGLVLHLKRSPRTWLQFSFISFGSFFLNLGFVLFCLELSFHLRINLILQSFDLTSLLIGVLFSSAFASAWFTFQFLLHVFHRRHRLLNDVLLDLFIMFNYTVPGLGLILVRPWFYQAIFVAAFNFHRDVHLLF